jgi:hypothetical protein
MRIVAQILIKDLIQMLLFGPMNLEPFLFLFIFIIIRVKPRY